MRIKLQDFKGFVCLPLPPSVTRERGFGNGDEVEVIHDTARGQIIVRPAGVEAASDGANPDFAGAVEDFLTRFEAALTELAKL